MRRRILDAAKALFVKEGFDNVSMRRIAGAIEYSPAALYRYFRNKREILSALRNEGFERFVRRQKAVGADCADPMDRLKVEGLDYIHFALEEPDNFQLMFCVNEDKVALDGEHAECAMESFELFQSTVAACLADGRFGDRALEEVLFSLWAGVHGLAHLLITGQIQALAEGVDVERLLENILDFNMRPA